MESKSSAERMCCKSFKVSESIVVFYIVNFVLVTTVTLPTLFYIFQPDHPPHTKLNGLVNHLYFSVFTKPIDGTGAGKTSFF